MDNSPLVFRYIVLPSRQDDLVRFSRRERLVIKIFAGGVGDFYFDLFAIAGDFHIPGSSKGVDVAEARKIDRGAYLRIMSDTFRNAFGGKLFPPM